MAARSTGIFPREHFDLDDSLKITATAGGTAAPGGVTLKYAKTIRVVVVGASGIDNAGTNKITVTVGGQAIVFQAQDLDGNGVGIAHIRGALCDVNNNAHYTLGGTAAIAGGVYLDFVEA